MIPAVNTQAAKGKSQISLFASATNGQELVTVPRRGTVSLMSLPVRTTAEPPEPTMAAHNAKRTAGLGSLAI